MTHTKMPASKTHQTLRKLVSILLNQIEIKPEDVSEPCLWQLAKSNQLLLALGRTVTTQVGKSAIPAPFHDGYLHLEAVSTHTTTLMGELMPAFAQRNLPILTIKSFLPFSYVDSNVDVVTVNAGNAHAYIQCLNDLGYQHQFNLADWREPYKKAYGKSSWQETNLPFPKVHLHQAISWNGIHYLNLSELVTRSTNTIHNGLEIPVPSPADELLIMAAHAFFENKYISLHELFYLTYLTPQINDWSPLLATAAYYHWQPALIRFLSIAKTVAHAVGLPIQLPDLEHPIANLPTRLPYLLPVGLTFAYSWQKLGQDVMAGHLAKLPRQLFSYSFVDAAWMYRKAWRKQRKVQSC